MKHYFFTFSPISYELRKLQKRSICQKKHLNLTNLVYFIIYVDKMTQSKLNIAIYESQI